MYNAGTAAISQKPTSSHVSCYTTGFDTLQGTKRLCTDSLAYEIAGSLETYTA